MMAWKYDDENNDPQFLRQVIAFLQSCLTQRGDSPVRPEFVPFKVRLIKTIRSETPLRKAVAYIGEYHCQHNQWGAISVIADDGKELGVRPSECIVLEMFRNSHLMEVQ